MIDPNRITLNNQQRLYLANKLINLSKSKFRNSFKLRKYQREYIAQKGLETVYKHACDFIAKRLAPEIIPNDGKQTPMRGHPVFIAQHATGTCCRSCLNKWHKIPANKQLSEREQRFIVELIMAWIEKQLSI